MVENCLQEVLQHLQLEHAFFRENPLFSLLKNKLVSRDEKLAIVPKLHFLMMGLQDIFLLSEDHRKQSDLIQSQINRHCLAHFSSWQQYMHDAELLASNGHFCYPPCSTALFQQDDLHLRRTQYLAVHHIVKNEHQPFFKLIVLVTLETSLRKIIEELHCITRKLPISRKLQFIQPQSVNTSLLFWLMQKNQEKGLHCSSAQALISTEIMSEIYSLLNQTLHQWSTTSSPSIPL